MSKFCPMCNQVTNCTDNCDACMREEYEIGVNDAIVYLKHLCDDFNNQGEHFEFVSKDAEMILMVVKRLEELQNVKSEASV